MNVAEEKRFAAACEDGTLCDPQYCPYMRGETSRLGACEGDYCEEAWKEFCEQNERDDP